MNLKISQYINKPILVSIPSLFESEKARQVTLLGVEMQGLWLQSDDLVKRLLHEETQVYASVGPIMFVPFAQITSVLIATRCPPETAGDTSTKKPSETVDPPLKTARKKKSPG